MRVKFAKYQGTGNDFILIDNRDLSFDHSKPDLIAKLCHRRFGIGADGLMCLQEKDGYDFEMVYFNSDGRISSMCGNGGRCIVAFANHLGLFKDRTFFLAPDGAHFAQLAPEGDWISLQMIDVEIVEKDGGSYVMNTGSPHYVTLVKNLKEKNMVEEGKTVRNSEKYVKEGINVNLVEDMNGSYFVRTYERGVEDETFACGTGVTAVAIAMTIEKGLTGQINTPLEVLGGKLNVQLDFDGSKFTNIFLQGPAEKIFEGEINLEKFFI